MEQLLRHTVSNDWMMLAVLSSTLLLVLAKHINSVRFTEFLQLVITDKYFYMQGKDTRFFSMFNVLLFLFQSLSFGMLLYLLGKTFFTETMAELRFPFLTIVVGYSIFTLVKIAIEKGVGMMFSIEKVLVLYIYQKISYRNWLALIVFACNILLIYSFSNQFYVLIGIVCFVLLMNTAFLIYLYKKQEKIILANLFYFILYLCTLEISPYIILYKTVLQ